jgi:hypothetical protein
MASNLHQIIITTTIIIIIIHTGLQNSPSEVYLLSAENHTTPMTTAEPERCFSTMKGIKTFYGTLCLKGVCQH